MRGTYYNRMTIPEKHEIYGTLVKYGFMYLMKGIAMNDIKGWVPEESICFRGNRMYYNEFNLLATLVVKARIAILHHKVSVRDMNVLHIINGFLDICEHSIKACINTSTMPDPHEVNARVGMLVEGGDSRVRCHLLIHIFREAESCKLEPGKWQRARFPGIAEVQNDVSAALIEMSNKLLGEHINNEKLNDK